MPLSLLSIIWPSCLCHLCYSFHSSWLINLADPWGVKRWQRCLKGKWKKVFSLSCHVSGDKEEEASQYPLRETRKGMEKRLWFLSSHCPVEWPSSSKSSCFCPTSLLCEKEEHETGRNWLEKHLFLEDKQSERKYRELSQIRCPPEALLLSPLPLPFRLLGNIFFLTFQTPLLSFFHAFTKTYFKGYQWRRVKKRWRRDERGMKITQRLTEEKKVTYGKRRRSSRGKQ